MGRYYWPGVKISDRDGGEIGKYRKVKHDAARPTRGWHFERVTFVSAVLRLWRPRGGASGEGASLESKGRG